jgi:hypothetical protein
MHAFTSFGLLLILLPIGAHSQVDTVLAPTVVPTTDSIVTAAPRWQRIYAEDAMSIWLDSQTIRPGDPGTLRVWTEWRYNNLQRLENGQRYDLMVAQYDIDCRSRLYQSRRIHLRRGREIVWSREVPAYELRWEEPIPDSLAEGVIDGVCFWAGFD